MAKIPTTLSLDADIKPQAQALFADLGLDLSTAVNMFLRQSLYVHGFPFTPQRDIPNAETKEAIQEVQRMKADPTLGKTYTDVDAMMEDLLA